MKTLKVVDNDAAEFSKWAEKVAEEVETWPSWKLAGVWDSVLPLVSISDEDLKKLEPDRP